MCRRSIITIYVRELWDVIGALVSPREVIKDNQYNQFNKHTHYCILQKLVQIVRALLLLLLSLLFIEKKNIIELLSKYCQRFLL